MKTEIIEERCKNALQSSLLFCFDSLEDIIVNRVYLMSGNRSNFKVVSQLGHFLFDFEDGKVRYY